MSERRGRFEIARHNDRRYLAPEPWNEWDDYAECWVCNRCGAAAGYQIHNFNCEHQAVVNDIKGIVQAQLDEALGPGIAAASRFTKP